MARSCIVMFVMRQVRAALQWEWPVICGWKRELFRAGMLLLRQMRRLPDLCLWQLRASSLPLFVRQ